LVVRGGRHGVQEDVAHVLPAVAVERERLGVFLGAAQRRPRLCSMFDLDRLGHHPLHAPPRRPRRIALVRKQQAALAEEIGAEARRVGPFTAAAAEALLTGLAQQKAAQHEASGARRSAEAEAQAAEERVSEMQAALDRVRNSRRHTLLSTVEEQEKKIVELKARRKVNQRKIRDANLDRRRAALATEKAQQAQLALIDYCVRELSADINLARIEQLEGELAAVSAQLAEQFALRQRYEAVAKPPKEFFFESGHFTTEVDLTALEVSSTRTLPVRARSTLTVPLPSTSDYRRLRCLAHGGAQAICDLRSLVRRREPRPHEAGAGEERRHRTALRGEVFALAARCQPLQGAARHRG
jgi:hypothetical protein